MTNREKFEAVFGVKFVEKTATFCAIAPDKECNGKECENCRYNRWWEEEYKFTGQMLVDGFLSGARLEEEDNG